MTETQSPPPPGADTDRQVGLDRENLRSYQRLTRSTTDRKIAGVAGGLGRHLNVDPTILRVLFVVLCFFGGAGFLLYGVAWLLVPEDGHAEGKISMSPNTRNGLLIATGVLAAVILVGNSWHGFGFPWPVFLIGLAVLVYLLVRNDDRPLAPPATGGPDQAGPPAAYQPVYGPPTAEQAGVTTYAPESTGEQPPPTPPWLAPPQPAPAYQPPPRPRKSGPRLFGPTLALVALALGVLGLYDVSGGQVADAAYPALALAVIGSMLVVGAFVGRSGGLIFLGIVAAIALAVTSLVGNVRDLNFQNGERLRVAPATAAGVRPFYDITSGRMVVDLSRVRDPQALDGRTIDLHARAGEVVVVLPNNVTSSVTAVVHGPGEVDLPDHSSGGLHTSLSGTYGNGAGTVSIDAATNVGHIEVRNP
jgi:phage shock protein PspC (stress-responsive transcriptional regulator)